MLADKLVCYIVFLTGSGVMVESPTYYHSLSPVLQSLKEFDMENFPLKEEIIYARPALGLPGYLKKATFETSIVCPPAVSDNSASTCTEKGPKDEPEKGELLEISGQQSHRKTEVNDSISPEDAMSVDVSGAPVEKTSSSTTCNEKISNECSSKDELNPEMRNIKSVRKCFLRALNVILGKCKNQSDGKQRNDNPVEQMDTDDTSVNSLHSNSLSINTESDLQGELGGRMKVERFLETFNSCSESSLEASQRTALIHVLKNKLAIVQGEYARPNRCTEYFFIVKIGKTRNCVKTLRPAGVVFPHNFSFFQFPLVLI